MGRALLYLLPIVLGVYAAVDCVQTPEDAVRGLPKVPWVLVILLFPYAGAALWFLAGRPPRLRPPSRRGPKGPDDDPDFLRKL